MCRWGCVSFMLSLLHGFRRTKHISNSLLKQVKSDHRRGHCCLNNSCSARERACVLGVGGANLSGATLKKQSRGPVNLDEPDRPWLGALLWEPLCDWTRVAAPLRPNRLLAAVCRDTDAHNVSLLLLLWRARADRNGQDARGDSEADKRIKQVRNIELALNRPTSARYIRDFTETHTHSCCTHEQHTQYGHTSDYTLEALSKSPASFSASSSLHSGRCVSTNNMALSRVSPLLSPALKRSDNRGDKWGDVRCLKCFAQCNPLYPQQIFSRCVGLSVLPML